MVVRSLLNTLTLSVQIRPLSKRHKLSYHPHDRTAKNYDNQYVNVCRHAKIEQASAFAAARNKHRQKHADVTKTTLYRVHTLATTILNKVNIMQQSARRADPTKNVCRAHAPGALALPRGKNGCIINAEGLLQKYRPQGAPWAQPLPVLELLYCCCCCGWSGLPTACSSGFAQLTGSVGGGLDGADVCAADAAVLQLCDARDGGARRGCDAILKHPRM